MSATFKVDGLNDILKRMEKVGDNIADKLTKKAARQGAKIFYDGVIAAAPRGPGRPKSYRVKSGEVRSIDYGHLADNIKLKITPKRYRNADDRYSAKYDVTTGDAFWAWFLEFGTVKMQPHPFMRPVLDSKAPAAIDQVTTVLKTGLTKAGQ